MTSDGKHQKAMNYRQEIDSLRAFAVTAVLVYHFWPNVLNYGYLGVDIFFVISGFLITLYICEENLKSTFSLWTFYQRRIKRILPNTLFVLFLTLTASAVILIGLNFERFLESLIASLAFTANIFFWRDGGYFGQNDALKPLLHIWSLSVEEQFYLFFPVAFLVLLRFSKTFRTKFFVIFIVSASSFFLHLYLIRIGGANPAFFLMPFRVWEFGAGSLSALFYFSYRQQHSYFTLFTATTLIFLGITLLPNLFVPGFISVIGTALFLSMAYKPNMLLNFFFESRFIRYLGLISFSTYLWHWPLAVFVGYVSISPPSTGILFLTLLLTYALSVLSYKFIEQPFRQNSRSKVVVFISLFTSILLLIISLSLLKVDFFKNPESLAYKVASSIQTNYRCKMSDYRPYGASRACLINNEANKEYKLVLLGNSHAQMYAPVIEAQLKTRNEKGLLVPLNGCLPIVQLNTSDDCLRLSKLNLSTILNDKKISTVIVGLTWHSDFLVDSYGEVINDKDKLGLSSAIFDLINRLEAGGKKVFLIGPLMIPNYDLPSILSREIKFKKMPYEIFQHKLRIDRAEFDSTFAFLIDSFKTRLGKQFILPSDVLCDKFYCYLGEDEGVYYSDSNHLSSFGLVKLDGLFNVIVEGIE